MIRLLLLIPLFPFASSEQRARIRARLALWLVRIAARLDVAVVVLTASAISTMADALTADALDKPEKPWPRSTLN